MKIHSVSICTENVFKMHNVNANEQGMPKVTASGYSYVSGQKYAHCLIDAMSKLNKSLKKSKASFSNADGRNRFIDMDIASDLRGFLDTDQNSYDSKRVSRLSVSFSVSKDKQKLTEDLFTRFNNNQDEAVTDNTKQRINTKYYSESDVFNFFSCLNVSELTTVQYNRYKGNANFMQFYKKYATEEERKNRVWLYIMATQYNTGLANQSRNVVDNTPSKVIISFSPFHGNDLVDFFQKTKEEQSNIVDNLKNRGAVVFIGDNTPNSGHDIVSIAYTKATELLENSELVDLTDGTVHSVIDDEYNLAVNTDVSKQISKRVEQLLGYMEVNKDPRISEVENILSKVKASETGKKAAKEAAKKDKNANPEDNA